MQMDQAYRHSCEREILVETLKFWRGGLALNAGALLALATYVLYVHSRELGFWRIADLVTAAALDHQFGGSRQGGQDRGRGAEHLDETSEIPIDLARRGPDCISLDLTHSSFSYISLVYPFVLFQHEAWQRRFTLDLTHLRDRSNPFSPNSLRAPPSV